MPRLVKFCRIMEPRHNPIPLMDQASIPSGAVMVPAPFAVNERRPVATAHERARCQRQIRNIISKRLALDIRQPRRHAIRGRRQDQHPRRRHDARANYRRLPQHRRRGGGGGRPTDPDYGVEEGDLEEGGGGANTGSGRPGGWGGQRPKSTPASAGPAGADAPSIPRKARSGPAAQSSRLGAPRRPGSGR